MSVEVTIIDMKMKTFTFVVDKSITIGELRKLYKDKGGNVANNQWKYDGEILKNYVQRFQVVKGFDPNGVSIIITSNVRGGGPIDFCDVSKKKYEDHTLTRGGLSYRIIG